MKKVRFSDNVRIYEVGNSEEDRFARNGPQDLRDRDRFQRRINSVEEILNNTLNIKLKKILFDVLPEYIE